MNSIQTNDVNRSFAGHIGTPPILDESKHMKQLSIKSIIKVNKKNISNVDELSQKTTGSKSFVSNGNDIMQIRNQLFSL